ncbi:hypothetical protein EPN81_01450 [Patescibacteria group bacterium]|nr:MAG: hypothetical protein EPN81_01450 [Patescibacteria group bacterium]
MDVARARALARAVIQRREGEATVSPSELEKIGRETILDKNPKTARAIAAASVGLTIGSTAAVCLGYGKGLVIGAWTISGIYAAWKLRFQALSAVDWFARKLDSWGDKLINKNVPVLKYIINPLVSLMDKTAKALGLDKSLAEYLKKDKEARKKLAEKVLKEYMASQKNQEKKEDDAKKKGKRKKKFVEIFGEDVAQMLEDEYGEKEKEKESAAEPKPAEAAKAT